MSRRTRTVLLVLAVLELLTLAVLLVNLATVHVRPVTQAIGPIHGAVYLGVVVIAIFAPGLRLVHRVLGCLPVVGGLLALVAVPVLERRGSRAPADRGSERPS